MSRYVHELSTSGGMRNAPPSGLMDNTREVAEFRPGQFVTGYGLGKGKGKGKVASLMKENARLKKLYALCMSGSEIKELKKPRTTKAESRKRDNEKVAYMMRNMQQARDLKEMKSTLKTNRQKRAIAGERAGVESMAARMQRLRDIKKAKQLARLTLDEPTAKFFPEAGTYAADKDYTDHFEPLPYEYTGGPITFDYYDPTAAFQYPYTNPTAGGCMRRRRRKKY